jgi:hypothetical protein
MEDGDTIAPTDPRGPEISGETVDPVCKLGIGEPPTPGNHGFLPGIEVSGSLQYKWNVHGIG